MGISEGCQEEDKSRYDGLKNAEFLKAYFKDHGITDEEIVLYSSWHGFQDLGKGIENNQAGMNYAQRRVESIIAYRDMTLDDLRKDYDPAPWAWPSAMRFHKIYSYTPGSMKHLLTVSNEIYLCVYEHKRYFFHIGKEEPKGEKLEKLLVDGTWLVYTWSD